MASYIKGVGMSSFGVSELATQELCYEAVMEALDDAKMEMDQIDAIMISKGDSQNDAERQRLFPAMISSILKKEGVPIVRVISACSGGGSAIWNAVHSSYENVLVIGAEKLTSAQTFYVTDDLMMASERIYEQSEGLNFPAQNALIAQQYLLRSKATLDDLALVSLKNHQNANLNPKARFYSKKVTLDMIKDSPIVASPLRLFDCSVSVDGAAAAIISKKKTDVEIAGSALCASRLSAFESNDMTSWEATIKSAKDAYAQAGVGPTDIDAVEIHDAFTSVELMSYEDLGFAQRGEGKKLIRKGVTKLNGDLPINPSGGLKAKGHPISATGISQIYELTKQIQGRAEKRQIDSVKTALAHNVGGVGSTVSVHILKKAA